MHNSSFKLFIFNPPLTRQIQKIMAKYSNSNSPVLLCFSLCLLVMSQGSNGYSQAGLRRQQPIGSREERGRCEILSLSPREPSHRVQHEAGVTEMWDQSNDQMECANVAATRHTIEPRGLLLPSFNNAPMLVYVAQGRGILGTMMPGCPETFESFQRARGERRIRGGRRARAGESMDDEHQKLHFFSSGALLAIPAGVAHWCYNDGDTPLVMVVVHDTGSSHNQLDRNLRRFFLAGNPEAEAQAQGRMLTREKRLGFSIGNNVFRGFDIELLAESFGVSEDTARQLQSENDLRGAIVKVDEELRLVRPSTTGLQRRWRGNNSTIEDGENGFEQTICSMSLRVNIDNPARTDVYTVRGGRLRTVNNFDLPILEFLQLSAKRGYLYRNAMITPQWNMNSHEVIYCIRGSARVQVVGSSSATSNKPVFDGELREGQLIVVPQNFASLAVAGEEGFEWITFMTSENAISSPLAGRGSTMTSFPVEVLMNMFMIPREDARRLKYNRQEMTILSPTHTTKGIRTLA